MKLGNNDIGNPMLGNTPINKVMQGSDLVWERSNVPSEKTDYRIFYKENVPFAKILYYYDTRDNSEHEMPSPDPGSLQIYQIYASKYNNVIVLQEYNINDIYKTTDLGANWELIANDSSLKSISPDGSAVAYNNNSDNIIRVDIYCSIYTTSYESLGIYTKLLNNGILLISKAITYGNLFDIYDVVNDTVLYHLDGDFRLPAAAQDLSKVYLTRVDGSDYYYVTIEDPLGTNNLVGRSYDDIFPEISYTYLNFFSDETGQYVVGVGYNVLYYSDDYGDTFLYNECVGYEGSISYDGKLVAHRTDWEQICYSFDGGITRNYINTGYNSPLSYYSIQQYTE